MRSRGGLLLAWAWLVTMAVMVGWTDGDNSKPPLNCYHCFDNISTCGWHTEHSCSRDDDVCFFGVMAVKRPVYKKDDWPENFARGLQGCVRRQTVKKSFRDFAAASSAIDSGSVWCKNGTIQSPWNPENTFNGTYCLCKTNKCNTRQTIQSAWNQRREEDEWEGPSEEESASSSPPPTTTKATTKKATSSPRKTTTTTRVQDEEDEESAEMERRRAAGEDPVNFAPAAPAPDKGGESADSGPSGGTVAFIVIVVLALMAAAGAVGYYVYTGKSDDVVTSVKDQIDTVRSKLGL